MKNSNGTNQSKINKINTSNGMSIKQKMILVGAVVVGVVIFVVFYRDANHPVLKNPTPAKVATTTVAWESKSDERGAVAITVTPVELSSNGTEWEFDVSLNTHSVELDWDMMKVARLIDNVGNSYSPQRWEGASGGHHREGVLIFKPVTPPPKFVELRIAGGNEPEKSFGWEVEN